MNHFDFHNMKLPYFQDPYAVEGAKSAKCFADNFNAHQLFGPSGFAEQCAIVREAHRSLLPKHLKIFCTKIGHARSSQIFKALRELGERYHQWETTFRSVSLDLAMFQIITDSPDAFKQMLLQGGNVMYMDADEIRKRIVTTFLACNGKG